MGFYKADRKAAPNPTVLNGSPLRREALLVMLAVFLLNLLLLQIVEVGCQSESLTRLYRCWLYVPAYCVCYPCCAAVVTTSRTKEWRGRTHDTGPGNLYAVSDLGLARYGRMIVPPLGLRGVIVPNKEP